MIPTSLDKISLRPRDHRSALWWLALSFLAAALRHRLTPHALRWVNRLSGLVMLFFGVMTLGGLLGF